MRPTPLPNVLTLGSVCDRTLGWCAREFGLGVRVILAWCARKFELGVGVSLGLVCDRTLGLVCNRTLGLVCA